jgi:SAM-dependent methyltransferase
MPYPARFYAALHRGTPGDLDHYARVCRSAATVLELGCGFGRVITALAAPGRAVVGVERDPELLAMAHAAVRGLPPDQGDDEDLHAALTTAARHLAPGGRVAFDVYRADAFHAEAEPDDVPDDAFTPVGRVEVDGVAYEVLERSTWDKPRQRIDVTYLHVDEAGHAIEGTIAQRYLLEPQLYAALARAGLRPVQVAEGFGEREADEADEADEDDEADDDALWVIEAEALDPA